MQEKYPEKRWMLFSSFMKGTVGEEEDTKPIKGVMHQIKYDVIF